MSEDTDSDSELEDDFEKDLDELDEDDDSFVVAMNVSYNQIKQKQKRNI
jgi:hypothetical protein